MKLSKRRVIVFMSSCDGGKTWDRIRYMWRMGVSKKAWQFCSRKDAI